MARHLALPIALTPAGGLATVAQDSAADIGQSLALLLDTRPTERVSVPDYGTPDMLFGRTDPDVIADAVAEWEPRADPADVTSALGGSPRGSQATVTIAAAPAATPITDDL